MARIDWGVSITPVEATTSGADGGPVQVDAISYNFKAALSAGNNSGTWAGNDSTEWSNGVLTHISSGGGTISVAAGSDAVWVKNTGFAYDTNITGNKGTATTTSNLLIVVTGGDISGGNFDLCKLAPGEGILLPQMNVGGGGAATLTMSDDGDPHAVEYAVFT